MKLLFSWLLLFISFAVSAQHLKLKHRSGKAMGSLAFAGSVSDSALTLDAREEIIFKEIQSGNIPNFYSRLIAITDTATINGKVHTIRYFVLPDFFAIGSDADYFYCPMRPELAQRVAELLKCSLPTRKMSDRIYQNAKVKMVPEPIPPSPKMITIPVFIKHSQLVNDQRRKSLQQFPLGNLVAGNKKDIALSNKIYAPDGKPRVVIYGWHKPDGKAIQPLYNGHNSDWVDYSHGTRLIQNKIWVDGKKTSIPKVLQSPELNVLLSDEGLIEKPFYPVK